MLIRLLCIFWSRLPVDEIAIIKSSPYFVMGMNLFSLNSLLWERSTSPKQIT